MKGARSLIVMDYKKFMSTCNLNYVRGFIAGAVTCYTLIKARETSKKEKHECNCCENHAERATLNKESV